MTNETVSQMNKFLAETRLPTHWGSFLISAFANNPSEAMPHIILKHPDIDLDRPVLVRIHSECLTGDIFHSLKCDCRAQLHQAMEMIQSEKGILIYLRQEGRGIGIINKLLAYQHQEKGLDTIKANEALGLQADYRRYDIAAEILSQLGVGRIRLLTNNPDKIEGLENKGIQVVERRPLVVKATSDSEEYLRTKKDEMGHLF